MLIKLRNVYVGYNGYLVLRNINLDIDKAGVVLIHGPNGGGKTTLLKTIAGLIKPLKGEVRVLRYKPYSPLFNRSLVGYVAQDPVHQLTEPTVLDELLLQSASKDKALYWAGRLGLTNLLNESPLRVSIGEMKRVLIASALAKEPRILLVDEPSLGQDADNLKRIISSLVEFAGKNRLVVIASHDPRIHYCLRPSLRLRVGDGRVVVEG